MPTLFAETALLPDGWQRDVTVEIGADGRIADVQTRAANDAGGMRVDTLLPAPSNLHSHTFQRAMAGLAERRGPEGRDSFWTWREIMYRFLDVLAPDEIEAIAAFAFMEMIEAGFGSVAEFHYLHNAPGGAPYADRAELSARIGAAAQDSGIGLTLLPVHYRQGGVDGRPLKGGQMRFGNSLDDYGSLLACAADIVKRMPADTGLGIAPHSLRAVPVDDLHTLAGWMPHAPMHMHAAEQLAEIDEMLAVHGARPMRFMLDNLDIDGRWCLIHCTHMQPDETEGLARSGAVAGLCPVTEANLGDGIFDGAAFVEAGGRLGVGSDSNIRISFNEELRQLEYSQRLRDRARVVMAGPGESAGSRLVGTALAGGARALGRDSGAIAPGKWADLVALSPAHGFSGEAVADEWIFCGHSRVAHVWSAGRHKVQQGRHVARDTIERRYATTLTDVLSRL